ncbi:MAG: biopolymer transporter ExbB [Paracoccaceae bacterium]|nr:biopolymer transporter ExbB [Paracoccaceae bacterium]
MEHLDPEAETRFTFPFVQLVSMLAVLGLVAAGTFLIFPAVEPVIQANPYLNGFIFFVFGLGIAACFWQIYQLTQSIRWIEAFAENRPGHDQIHAPRLLASVAALLRARGVRAQISATSSGSMLDSVATRIDEARDITRYIVNLLIFLGLLGTFYGLSTTVPAVVDTIKSLAPQEGESSVDIFDRLIGGLEAQLGGMGTAFGSSLLGLAGSLVVGLLELFASQSQNRFYRQMEDWISTITRVGFSSGDGEGSGGDTSVLGAVLDNMAEQMEGMQRLFIQSDEARSQTDKALNQLTVSLDRLSQGFEMDKATASGDMGPGIQALIDGQERLIAKFDETFKGDSVDAESRMRLRSIDVQLLRILEEMSAGRQETVADLRNEVTAITKAIRTLTRKTRQDG